MYTRDLEFTNTARKLITDQLYPQLSVAHITIGGTPGSEWIQQNAHIDAILQRANGISITVEEKIVRRAYPSFALEVWSNVEWERPGWMYTCTADWLLYAFVQPYGMDCYIMQFPVLKRWFDRVCAAEHYHPVDTRNEKFTSRCVLVPIDELSRAIRVSKYVLKG